MPKNILDEKWVTSVSQMIAMFRDSHQENRNLVQGAALQLEEENKEELANLAKSFLLMNVYEGNFCMNHFLHGVEKKILQYVMVVSDGRQRKAAQLLGIKPSTLNEKLKRYNIRKRCKIPNKRVLKEMSSSISRLLKQVSEG